MHHLRRRLCRRRSLSHGLADNERDVAVARPPDTISAVTYILVPLIVLLAIVVLLGVFVLLSRFRGGRYLRPVVRLLSKVGFIRRWIMKASVAALERENPPLASAMKKAELFGTPTTPQQVQKFMSRLTADERRAYLAAAGEQQQSEGAEPVNRQQRRQLERLGQQTQGGGRPARGKSSRKKKR